MSKRRIYILGASFNPPGKHHLELARFIVKEKLNLSRGDKLIVVPCGTRPDKQTTNDIDPVHRAAMTQLVFGNMPGVEIDFSDLEGSEFTRTWDLEKRFESQYPDASIWHVVGLDLIQGGAQRNSEIQKSWYRGNDLFYTANFLVLSRNGQLPSEEDLPPYCEVGKGSYGSSSEIRVRAAARGDYTNLVTPEVAGYMQRWHLYTHRPVLGATCVQLSGPGIVCSVPEDLNKHIPGRLERIRSLVQMAERVNSKKQGSPDHIIVIGGDGWMLDTIRSHAHLRLPFVGLNAGTVGYLLNNGCSIQELENRLHEGSCVLFREPLLHIEATRPDHSQAVFQAFNEGFLRTTNDGSGWMNVLVDDIEVFDIISGDGLMLATPGGSTGWSRAKGGQPGRIGEPHLILTGDGTTFKGKRWVSTTLEDDSLVSINVIDGVKRPMRLVVDGKPQGLISSVKMRRSRTYAAEIGFFAETVRDRRIERIRNG